MKRGLKVRKHYGIITPVYEDSMKRGLKEAGVDAAQSVFEKNSMKRGLKAPFANLSRRSLIS